MSGDSGHGTDLSDHCDDSDARSQRRRQLLTAGGGVAATLLAGCSNILPGGSPEIDADAATGNSTGTKTPPGPGSETHVTGLQYKPNGAARTFFVTLAPSNSGTDWWQVETLDGEKIARKTFDGVKTGGRFTTTKEVEIADGVENIVVRGHSAETGYGGQVMLADLSEGYIAAEKQGTQRKSFKDYSF